jgi:hypothetical protein
MPLQTSAEADCVESRELNLLGLYWCPVLVLADGVCRDR